jgi:hypothetical protein
MIIKNISSTKESFEMLLLSAEISINELSPDGENFITCTFQGITWPFWDKGFSFGSTIKEFMYFSLC